MASLETVYEHGRCVHELACRYWEEFAYVSEADLGEAATILEELSKLAAQMAADYTALNKALEKTRA